MDNFIKTINFNIQTYIYSKKILATVGVGLFSMFTILILFYFSFNGNTPINQRGVGYFNSLCEISTLIFYFTFNFSILLLCYVIQNIELDNSLELKFLLLPAPAIYFYFSRLFIIITIVLIFTFFYLTMSYFLLHYRADYLKSNNSNYYFFLYIGYLNQLLISSFGYIVIVVLLSFYIKNLIIGFCQIFICFLLSFSPDFFFLPSSFGYKNFRHYATINLYPDSILKNESNHWVFYSTTIFILVCLSIGYRIIRFYSKSK